jgi:hypothetical protein
MPSEPQQPVDLAALTHEQLSALVGDAFQARLPDGSSIALTLAEAKKLGAARPGQRAPFSLLFRPADPKFYAPQQVLPLAHARLGVLEIFLVPIKPDAAGARFEAIFT